MYVGPNSLHSVREDGVESRAVVHNEETSLFSLLLQMSSHSMESRGYGIFCGPVCPVCKMILVSVGGSNVMGLRTSFAKHFITIRDETANGRFLRQRDYGGRLHAAICDRDSLKILVMTPSSWSVESFSTHPAKSSGPVAFLGLTALNTLLTSCSFPLNFRHQIDVQICVYIYTMSKLGPQFGRSNITNLGRQYDTFELWTG